MLVTLNEILPDAKKNHYAVGLFNTVDLEMAKGVIAAAEEADSPVIIGTAEVLLPFSSLEELAPMLVPLAKRARVPVVLHFDHGLTPEKIRRAMDLGFTSIMYDCSTSSFESNCREVAAMVRLAHSRGVSVEAELGHVGANDGSAEGEGAGDHSIYTEPLEALKFAQATGVDALAVAIGTAHGAYKSKPKLDFGRRRKSRNWSARRWCCTAVPACRTTISGRRWPAASPRSTSSPTLTWHPQKPLTTPTSRARG